MSFVQPLVLGESGPTSRPSGACASRKSMSRDMIRVKVTIQSDELSKDDLRALLQAIRDCEQRFFKEKRIWVRVDAPDLGSSEMNEVLTSVNPPYEYGPIIINRRPDEAA